MYSDNISYVRLYEGATNKTGILSSLSSLVSHALEKPEDNAKNSMRGKNALRKKVSSLPALQSDVPQ